MGIPAAENLTTAIALLIWNTLIFICIAALSTTFAGLIGFSFYTPIDLMKLCIHYQPIPFWLYLLLLESLFTVQFGFIIACLCIYNHKLFCVSAATAINIEKALFGACAFLFSKIVSGIVIYCIFPQSITYKVFKILRPTWQQIINITILSLTTSIQTYVEEIVFRHPITLNQSPAFLTMSVLFFVSLHLCGGIHVNTPLILSYLLTALTFSIPTFFTKTIDYAFGAHLLNNLLGLIVFAPLLTPLPGFSLYVIVVKNTHWLFELLLALTIEPILFTKLACQYEKVSHQTPYASLFTKSYYAYYNVYNDFYGTFTQNQPKK